MFTLPLPVPANQYTVAAGGNGGTAVLMAWIYGTRDHTAMIACASSLERSHQPNSPLLTSVTLAGTV